MGTGRMPLLRTAFVGGVAYTAGQCATAKATKPLWIDVRQDAQMADLFLQLAPPPSVTPAPESFGSEEPGALEQLKQLGALRDSKILTEAEFETVKKKILDAL